ncbi:MAG: SPFH domain-containing protein [Planctomycetaceae bacterium]
MFYPELLAASSVFGPDGPPYSLLIALVVLGAFVGIVIFAAKRYKRCPSNRVLVIYGKIGGGRSATCIHGGGRFVLPIIQDYRYLNLEPIQIEIPLKDALSSENIRVNVPSVFTVAISIEPEVMQNAAIRLLDLNTQQVKKQAEDMIFGQLRQVIASMGIEDINRDREKFLHNIQNSVEPELRKIGLVLINVNITDITDESGYIEAIGRKAASEAVQKARGDVADQERMGEVRVAEADRDKMVSVADAQKTREIGMRGAEREKAVRIADLSKEQQVGEQRASFQREMEVADADREKRVSVANANAIAFTGEAESQAKIAAAQAQLQVKKSDAYQLGETRKREAEAAVLEAQNRAMAKAALADAERVEAQQRAELEAPAKAQKAKIIVDAEAEAQKRRLEAEGQAAAIFAKLEAEAKGQYEILAKKGEGLRKIVEACGGPQEAFQLLMLEHMDKLAETAAQAISNIKFDKIIVWENGSQNGKSSTANFLQGMTQTLPPMLQVMKEIGGVEMPEIVGRLMPDLNTNGGTPTVQKSKTDGTGAVGSAQPEQPSPPADSLSSPGKGDVSSRKAPQIAQTSAARKTEQ